MSTAIVDVWITAIDDFCHITSQTYAVNVVDCSGKPLTWCGREYKDIEARCGHVQLELPPGCYAVFAAEFPSGIPPFGNMLTHLQVVRVNCGDHACVTLFAPSAHLCGSWFGAGLRGNLPGFGNGGLNLGAIEAGMKAVDEVLRTIPGSTLSTNLATYGAPPKSDR